ncbi:hypothetical protein [uncultured Brevundimonas sp.]|uniref:hypothetical protein n=1 Tax=uncultured Brevundimonas sp. TaxID=213418 RepID=UPI0026145CF4|nr:hypothetical protein [uncultured Brevundimonas sp.]
MIVPVLMIASLSAGFADEQQPVVATSRDDLSSAMSGEMPEPVLTPSATVQSSSMGLTTAQQIDRWIARETAGEEAPVWRETEPRKVSGEISLGIGTNDYRAVAARVDVPIGENGNLSLSYSESRNGFYPYGNGYWGGYDPLLGDAWGGPWTTPSGQSWVPYETRTRINRPRPLPGD